MIGILHGYLLDGSGSNLWTRAVVRALVRRGETVHLVCQENRPEDHDFVAAAYLYEPDGTVARLFEREVAYPGRCVLHRPRLGDTLPVYVADRYEGFARAVPMVNLPDSAIEAYLARNVAVVERVVRDNAVTSIHANHAVLMSVVAERVRAAGGPPYAVMPHGSAIEYAVKRDPRFHRMAAGAFEAAARIFVIGGEMRRRVLETFPDLPGLAEKLEDLPLGVDTGTFGLVDRAGRAAEIARLAEVLKDQPRGRAAAAMADLDASLTRDELRDALAPLRNYEEKRPDDDLEAKLGAVDWAQGDLLLFVGRLIAAKGLQSLVAALPAIFEARPQARLLVVGHGPLREVMEALLWALQQGAGDLVRKIAQWGSLLEEGAQPFEDLRLFFDELTAQGEWDAYLDAAKRTIRPERVIFTGYLTHRELRHLFPCCDVAVFPSAVAEAGPLVFLEALASGCLPLGTYFAGMAASIDAVAGAVAPEVAETMKLMTDPAAKVAEIAVKATAALALDGTQRQALRDHVVAHHDWTGVAARLAAALSEL